MTSWRERWVDKYYDRSKGWVDGTTQFHALCRANIPPRGARICEIGAGPSNQTSRFLATIGEVHGVDIDDAVLGNDALASGHVVTDDRFPFDDESMDACVSNYVIEHVENPDRHLREVFRILKRGGYTSSARPICTITFRWLRDTRRTGFTSWPPTSSETSRKTHTSPIPPTIG